MRRLDSLSFPRKREFRGNDEIMGLRLIKQYWG